MESLPAEKTKILYVEDNPVNMALVKRLLTVAGYEVLEAGNGVEGIRVAKEEFPALIIMDINLPDMGGHEASTKIKGMEALREIPIIALTANVLPGDRERSLTAGCDGYISKPVDIKSFVPEVEKYLKGKRENVSEEEESNYLREYSSRLVDSLESKVEELKGLNEELEKRVEERTRELVDSNAKLEERNRALRGKQKIIEASQRELGELLTETSRQKLELEKTLDNLGRTQGQLLHSEKMASIGQLAAGVAHEINNPIGFIASNVGILGDYMEDLKGLITLYEQGCKGLCAESEDLFAFNRDVDAFKEEIDYQFIVGDTEKIVDETREGTERVVKIIEDLKNFSHVDQAEKKHMDINLGIETTLSIVNNELKYKAKLVKEYGDIPQVECFPQQINQVFMNLLVNASQAIEEQGEIRVKTLSDGGKVVVRISDTGSGIAPEVMNRIFDPFFTTKPVGKGTGLGLSISYEIIKKHGGHIGVESEAGKGTTFSVELPATKRRIEGDKTQNTDR